MKGLGQMDKVHGLLRCTRLAIQEFGPSMGMLMLPGGYLIALTGLIYRHWPLGLGSSQQPGGSPETIQAERRRAPHVV
jgi:hypothetical protein